MELSVPHVLALGPSGRSATVPGGATGGAEVLGVLDCGLGFDAEATRRASWAFAGYLDRPFGLRLPAEAALDLQGWPDRLVALVLVESRPDAWVEMIARAKRTGRVVMAEVGSLASAQAATEAGADGLVTRGVSPLPASTERPLLDWPAELFVWRVSDAAGLRIELDGLRRELAAGSSSSLRELAEARARRFRDEADEDTVRLAVVGHSLDDLRAKLDRVSAALGRGTAKLDEPSGVYYAERSPLRGASSAFVFPGQGSQYPAMFHELAAAFPEVEAAFTACDEALGRAGCPPIGPLIGGSAAAADDAATSRRRTELASPERAQPAVAAACAGLLRLLAALGVEPDRLAGHSFGELVALHAAGCFSLEDLTGLSVARGRLLLEAAGADPGAMAALAAGPERVAELLGAMTGVRPVHLNGPGQTVLSGETGAIEAALELARAQGVAGRRLAVACAFHSEKMAGVREPLARLVAELGPRPPRIPTYSGVTSELYPAGPGALAELVGEQATRPVRFAEMIERMYADGVRVFIEVGPGTTLAPLIDAILNSRPHAAIACDRAGRSSVLSLLHMLGRLVAGGSLHESIASSRIGAVAQAGLSPCPFSSSPRLPPRQVVAPLTPGDLKRSRFRSAKPASRRSRD